MNFDKPNFVESKREHYLGRHTLDFFFEGAESPRRKEYIQFLEEAVNDEKNYIDEGGAGKVYRIGEGKLCIKLMPKRDRKDFQDANDQTIRYNLGNSVKTEAWFTEELAGFEVDGVRSPSLVEYLEGEEYTAIVMETLDAVNLQHVLNGTAKLPEAFNVDDFFYAVESYMYSLHDEKNIAHGDLEPRNIMVDLKTGMPRIIDFGRSHFLGRSGGEERRRLEAQEIGMIDKAKNKIQNYLNNPQVKRYA